MAKITITIDTEDMSDVGLDVNNPIIDPIIHTTAFRAETNTLHTIEASTGSVQVLPFLNPTANSTFTVVVLEASEAHKVVVDFISEGELVYGKLVNYEISYPNANVKFRYVSQDVGYIVDQG